MNAAVFDGLNRECPDADVFSANEVKVQSAWKYRMKV
jgi:hypothetical protein